MVCVVGIDFGIINFVVLVLEGGDLVVVVNFEGFRIILLIVVFVCNGEVLVGQFVKNQVVINVDCIVCLVK